MSPRTDRADGYRVCPAHDVPPGARKIVDVCGRSIGIFNVDGQLYALRNRCPHKGGPLCEGLVSGTTLPTNAGNFSYGQEGCILRCAWHGWEFDITTGSALADPRFRARTYPVRIQDGHVIVTV